MATSLVSTDAFNTDPNLSELNKVVEDLYKKDKFLIAPAGATFKENDKGTYSPVPDPLQIAIDLIVPSADDIETMFVSIIGCVPNTGPVLQGVYGCFSARSAEQELTKDDIKKVIDERMTKFKSEMNAIIDDKIAKSEAKQYKTICENSFNGVVESSLEMLMDHLTELKKKLLKGEDVKPTSSILESLRHKFDTLRANIKALFPLYRDPAVIPSAYPQFIELTYIYVLTLRNLMCYWHQYGFPPECARGTPEIKGTVKETHSYRMKLHLNIHKNLKVLQDNLTGKEKDLGNVGKLLECDPILYPIPLVKAPVVIPPNDYSSRPLHQCSGLTYPTTKIDVSQRATPFIYRIDGACFTGNPYRESVSGGPRKVFKSIDPITGCTGGYLVSQDVPGASVDSLSLGLIIILSEPKYVSVRAFISHCNSDGFISNLIGLSPGSGANIYLDNFHETCTKKTFDYESGSMKDFMSDEFPPQMAKTKSGFYITKKSSFPIGGSQLRINSSGRLLFVELVISDK